MSQADKIDAGFTVADTKALVIESLQLEGMTSDSIGDDDPLFGDGLGLDSVDALELVVAMEKRFKIKIQSNEIDPEAFASASSLCSFINAQIAKPA